MKIYRNHPGCYELDSRPHPITGEAWANYYTLHVCALTDEDMHSKPAIAAELAYRDRQLDELRAELAAKQMEIDRLMREYCPDEMTPEQLENWGDHQRVSDFKSGERRKGEGQDMDIGSAMMEIYRRLAGRKGGLE